MIGHIKVQIVVLFLFVVLVCLFIANCTTTVDEKHVKNGKQYGVIDETFRGEWYHYYKRGISFASGGFWEEAIRDLKEAMDVSGRRADKRNASTYGMHKIHYFPHRELGIIYYRMGDYKASVKELELSRDQYDTARSRHYLDEARTALVVSLGQDRQEPKIVMKPKVVPKTNSFFAYLSGTVSDDTYIKSVLIDGEPFYTATSQGKVEFQKQVRLSPGVNPIKIEATDISGNKSEETIDIEVDSFGPAISFDSPQSGDFVPSRECVFKGIVFDKSGVESLSINGKPIKLAGDAPPSFSHKLALADGVNTISYAAEDTLGNKTAGAMEVTVGLKKAERKHDETFVKLASAQLPQSNVPLLHYSNTPSFQGLVVPLFNAQVLAFPKSKTTPRPEIEIGSPFMPTPSDKAWPEFYGEVFPCKIRVKAPGGLKSVEINGEDRSDNICQGRILQEFDQRIPLQEGNNEIKVTVIDTQHRKRKRRWNIKRVRWESDYLLVFQVQKMKGDTRAFKASSPEETLAKAIRDTRRFNAVDVRSDASEVDALLKGWINDYESGTEVGVEIEVVDPEMKDLLPKLITKYRPKKNKDKSEKTTEEDIKIMFQELAKELVANFPVVQGKITVVADKNEIEASWGGEVAEMLRRGYRLIAFHYDKEKNYRPEVRAYARITAIRSDKTDAEIFKNISGRPKKNDLVITK